MELSMDQLKRAPDAMVKLEATVEKRQKWNAAMEQLYDVLKNNTDSPVEALFVLQQFVNTFKEVHGIDDLVAIPVTKSAMPVPQSMGNA